MPGLGVLKHVQGQKPNPSGFYAVVGEGLHMLSTGDTHLTSVQTGARGQGRGQGPDPPIMLSPSRDPLQLRHHLQLSLARIFSGWPRYAHHVLLRFYVSFHITLSRFSL